MKAKTYSALQKTYDQSYLTCSTAAYYETQGNEVEALRCWRECLVQLQAYNSFTHRARSETERALVQSLQTMKEQCEERAQLLETILLSRKTVENSRSNHLVRSDSQSSGKTRQSVPPISLQSSQPSSDTNDPSSTNNSYSTITLAHSLTPKVSRSPSPDRRGFLSTLRSNRKPKKTTGSPDTIHKEGPAAAAKAATLAWSSISRAEGANLHQTLSAPSMESLTTRPGFNSTSSTPEITRGEQSGSSSAERGAQNSALVLPKRLGKGRSRSRPHSSVLPQGDSFPPTSPHPPPHLIPVQTTSKVSNSPQSRPQLSKAERGPPTPPPKIPPRPAAKPERLSRIKITGRRRSLSDSNTPATPITADGIPDNASAGSQMQKPNANNSEDKDTVVDEDDVEERGWKRRITKALKAVGKGVDQDAARQVANEIVVKGDEVHWEDVAGLEAAKLALKEAVVYPFLRPDLFSGLREPARGMLLFGPPGTGKTMLARAVATESKSTFFAISASSLTSKFLGESEKLVRALFQLAKALAPSIIFVDEIDSLLSARSGSGEHEATRRIKTEFLIQWSELAHAAAGKETSIGDASRVLVLAATNLPWAIDEAARRRFVRRQYIPLPEDDTRAKQLRNLLGHQKHQLSDDEMRRLITLTEGFSGSDITALAKDAAMGPLRSLGEALLHMKMEEIRPISFADFEASLISIRPSVGKEGLRAYEQWAKQYGERVS